MLTAALVPEPPSNMRVALHNPHLLPNVGNLSIHNYAIELLRQKRISTIYISDRKWGRLARAVVETAKAARRGGVYYDIDWSAIEWITSTRELNRKVDVLLNLNMMYMPDLESECGSAVRQFNGLKVFHIGDYFWNHPATELNQWLEYAGVQQLMGYAMHDRHCRYFQARFPRYAGKVWNLPFGFADRFRETTPVATRRAKIVALGSVNPMRPLEYPVYNFRDSADFFPDENWFHKFRRQLVLNSHKLSPFMDSMLPIFPQIKDFRYNLPAKFNEYQAFVTCESIFWFPCAKVYEGMACGALLVCARHPCNADIGLRDNVNCVMYEPYDLDDFIARSRALLERPDALKSIAERGARFVREHYSHRGVSGIVSAIIEQIARTQGKSIAAPIAEWLVQPAIASA